MSAPVEPGEIVGGRYEIVGRIGKGGMGVVFEARHATVGRRLAIKFLRSDLPTDERRLLRFEREARACGALHHENVAAVLDLATDHRGRPYIVMEFVDGLSLRELLETNGPLGVGRSCSLICQAARGLSAAHQAGILHRDLKPENLMVTRRGDGSDCLKLLDFGVARLAEDGETIALTREGQAPGTPYYLAPEIARGESSASVQSDIYSLGVVLFELLTGRRPHTGESYNAVIHRIAQHPAPPIERLKPEVPAPIARVINRTLSQDPGGRPQSALELVEALQSASAGKPFLDEAGTISAPHLVSRRSAPERRRSKRGVLGRAWWLVALAGLVATSVALFELRPPSTFELDRPGAASAGEEAPVAQPLPAAKPRGPVHPPPASAAVQAPSAPPDIARQESPPAPREPTRPQRAAGRAGPQRAPAPSSAPATQQGRTQPAGSFDRENPFRD